MHMRSLQRTRMIILLILRPSVHLHCLLKTMKSCFVWFGQNIYVGSYPHGCPKEEESCRVCKSCKGSSSWEQTRPPCSSLKLCYNPNNSCDLATLTHILTRSIDRSVLHIDTITSGSSKTELTIVLIAGNCHEVGHKTVHGLQINPAVFVCTC